MVFQMRFSDINARSIIRSNNLRMIVKKTNRITTSNNIIRVGFSGSENDECHKSRSKSPTIRKNKRLDIRNRRLNVASSYVHGSLK